MAEAKLNKEYAIRFCGVAAIMLAITVWSIYDGSVAWPKINAAMDKVRPVLIEMSNKGITPEMWLANMVAATNLADLSTPEKIAEAAKNGAGTYLLKEVFARSGASVPKHLEQEVSMITTPAGDGEEARKARAEQVAELFEKPIYSQSKLNSQYIQAAVTFLFAAWIFYLVVSKRKTTYTADDAGLGGSGFGGQTVPWSDVVSVNWSKWEDKGIVAVTLKDKRVVVLDGWHFAGVRDIVKVIQEHGFMPPSAAEPKK